MYNFDDIEITEYDRERLEGLVESISVSAKINHNYNSIGVNMGMSVDPELGKDKCYKYLRQQVKYMIQQAKKDLDKEYWNK